MTKGHFAPVDKIFSIFIQVNVAMKLSATGLSVSGWVSWIPEFLQSRAFQTIIAFGS
jgi:hypothetical protein